MSLHKFKKVQIQYCPYDVNLNALRERFIAEQSIDSEWKQRYKKKKKKIRKERERKKNTYVLGMNPTLHKYAFP